MLPILIAPLGSTQFSDSSILKNAIGTPGCTNMDASVNIYGSMKTWDTSKVTDMSQLFKDCTTFTGMDSNGDQILPNWDTSSVTTMASMFENATAFDGSFGEPGTTMFDTSSVTDMSLMFYDATSFNQPLTTFDTSSVTNMQGMFEFAGIFNQPVAHFKTSNVAISTL